MLAATEKPVTTSMFSPLMTSCSEENLVLQSIEFTPLVFAVQPSGATMGKGKRKRSPNKNHIARSSPRATLLQQAKLVINAHNTLMLEHQFVDQVASLSS